MRANTNANTANPSTIAAGVTEMPKISGLLLLALMAAAQHSPCKMASEEQGHASQHPDAEQAG